MRGAGPCHRRPASSSRRDLASHKINRPDPLDSGVGVAYIEGVNNATRTAAVLPACTCGLCPAIRMQNGFAPFCSMRSATSASRSDVGDFDSYAAASAAKEDGQRVVCVRGSFLTGQPARFALVASRKLSA